MSTGTPCVFCTNQDIQQRVIARNGLVWAFPTNIPITPGHILVCPVRHVKLLSELTDEERLAIFRMADLIANSLKQAFGATGFNYAWNEEAVAGQSVPHWHLHVVPRQADDEGIYQYEPRQFLYRPGSRAASPETELQHITNLVRASIENNDPN